MRGVPARNGGLLVGKRQEPGIMAIAVDDAARQGRGERAVRGRLDGNPVDAGHRGRHGAVRKRGIDDVDLELACCEVLRGAFGRALEVDPARSGEPAEPQRVLGLFRIRHHGVDRFLQKRARAIGSGAAGHVPVLVEGAERSGEATAERAATVGTPAQHDQLVRDGAQIGLLGVHRRRRVAERFESFDVAIFSYVGEQLAALGHLLDKLIPADGLPLSLAALARALERHRDAIGLADRVERAVAAPAHRPVQHVALAVGIAHRAVRLLERLLVVQVRVCARGVVRVAAHAQHAPGCPVELHAIAARAVASHAARVPHDHVFVDRNVPCFGIDARLDGLACPGFRESGLGGNGHRRMRSQARACERQRAERPHRLDERASIHVHVPHSFSSFDIRGSPSEESSAPAPRASSPSRGIFDGKID